MERYPQWLQIFGAINETVIPDGNRICCRRSKPGRGCLLFPSCYYPWERYDFIFSPHLQL